LETANWNIISLTGKEHKLVEKTKRQFLDIVSRAASRNFV